MTPTKKRYTKHLFKGLLAAAYILFFFIQFNLRGASLATFLHQECKKAATFSSIHIASEGQSEPVAVLHKVHGLVRAHWSFDTKFRDRTGIDGISSWKLQSICSILPVCKSLSSDEFLSAGDPGTLLLRGPPRA